MNDISYVSLKDKFLFFSVSVFQVRWSKFDTPCLQVFVFSQRCESPGSAVVRKKKKKKMSPHFSQPPTGWTVADVTSHGGSKSVQLLFFSSFIDFAAVRSARLREIGQKRIS